MALRLKTKFTLFTSLLVLAIVAIISVVYVARLTRQAISEAQRDAQSKAQQIFQLARSAYGQAVESGMTPTSEGPADIRAFVQQALEQNQALMSNVKVILATSPTIYEVTITDQYGIAMVSSDSSMVGRPVSRRPSIDLVRLSGVVEQLRVLYGPFQVYELTLPFDLGGVPYGEVRVSVSTIFWRNQVEPELKRIGILGTSAVFLATLLAAFVSHVSLAPLGRITMQVERLSKGQFETDAAVQGKDELGQLSTRIAQIGQQLRGVREIFGSPRENPAQAMAALEDGLLLFSQEGSAVLATPGAEKFLNWKPRELLGKQVSEIFPPGSPFAHALRIVGNNLSPIESVEVQLNGKGSVKRASVSIQPISSEGAHIGALVTLRDMDSRERIGSQLQRTESLDVLERILAGVAHEVRQPLNSMSLWVQILKESMQKSASSSSVAVDSQEVPPAHATDSGAQEDNSQKALKVLDSEIHRLNRAVTTFLDFTRRVEPSFEKANIADLVRHVLALAKPQIEGAGIELVAELSDSTNIVLVDRELIQQAVLNLVLNAVQAMCDGEPATQPTRRLTVSVERKNEQADVRIADTGHGISPQDYKYVFQLFFSKRPGGSGIGLATAFRIVQLHNGSIDFESEVGHGTTFRIQLPLARAEEKEPAIR